MTDNRTSRFPEDYTLAEVSEIARQVDPHTPRRRPWRELIRARALRALHIHPHVQDCLTGDCWCRGK